MSTAELQNQVIKRIISLKDDRILREVLNLINIEIDDEEIVELTSAQKEAIDEAKLQIKNEQFSTNEEFDKEIDEWLNE